jgi:hypothetical protein
MRLARSVAVLALLESGIDLGRGFLEVACADLAGFRLSILLGLEKRAAFGQTSPFLRRYTGTAPTGPRRYPGSRRTVIQAPPMSASARIGVAIGGSHFISSSTTQTPC